jgi:N-acetylmuramoyl-L-alanine amidase
MLRKLIPLMVLPALALHAAGSEKLRVTAVRHWTLADATRVAVEVSGAFQYRADRLHNPERIFFDIHHAKPPVDSKRMSSTDVGSRQVKRIRMAETQPGVTRIVMDLESNTEFTASQLVNPDRLMIEIRSASAPAIPAISEAAPRPTSPSLPAPPPLPKPAATAAAAVPPPVSLPKNTPADAADPPPVVETGQAARHTSNGRNSLTRALGLKITRVVIDPGHGGQDQGTMGPKGLLEKELVLDVGLRLGKLIEERLGSEVIYTRTDDSFVPLEGRTELANEKKADLFLSIHANSSPYPTIRGVETYYLNLTNAKDALDVAARENASSQKSVFELRELIQKITLADKIEESKEFAGRMQSSLQAFERSYSSTAKNRGVKKAPFVVLIGASMPSILAEIGFISNTREEALLKRQDHRQKLAEALYRGVSRYAQSLSHFQVAQNSKEEE